MFGNGNQIEKNAGTGLSYPGAAQAQAPPQPGASTALKELNEEIMATCKIASEFRQTLGINILEQGAEKLPDENFAALIRRMTHALRGANGDFGDALRHLNT